MSKQVQADTLLRDTAVNVQRDIEVNVQRDVAVNVQRDVAVNEQSDIAVSVQRGVAVNEQSDIAVSVRNITKNYEQWQRSTDRRALLRNLIKPEKRIITALDDVSFQVEKGEFVAYAGANGAGKSTTMKILGQRMKADLALLLLHEPELILLDEPTIGLDVLAKRQMIGFLKDLNRLKKTTILVTSHDMDDLEEMARRIILVSKGHIAYDGSFGDLRTAAGCMCRIAVTIEGDDVAAELESAEAESAGVELGSAGVKSAGVALGRADAESAGVALGRADAESAANDDAAAIGSDGRSVLAANGNAAPAVANNCAAHPADHRSAPVIPNASLISGSRGVFEYEFDQQATPITSILSSISRIRGVKDVEIKKAPIEEVITGLYLKWKGIA